MTISIRKSALLLLALAFHSAHGDTEASRARLDIVAERGRHVMPFSLESTLHVFNKNSYGGIQQVIAKTPSEKEQVELIRQHLTELEQRFRQGDFSRQRRIHGNDMPGISEIANNYQRIQFVYRELPNGAEIEYSTEDPALIDAIHRYFNAQLRDHARHAVGSAPHCQRKLQHHGHNAAPSSTEIKE
ncbi:MAG: aspartate carbamoyltransferase [Gammaproteobacteria bacterium]